MLSVVGVRSLDELFADIPAAMRPQSFDLPGGKGEAEVCAYFEDLAAQNRPDMVSFLGAGYYAHQIPQAVNALSGRSEFYTAYTPYQAECSQGTLQAIFEFQTAVSRLLDIGRTPDEVDRTAQILCARGFQVEVADCGLIYSPQNEAPEQNSGMTMGGM